MRKPDHIVREKVCNNTNTNNNNNTKEMLKLRKGLWSPEEDEKLMNYMLRNGQGCWTDIARNAGLQRCGKSCRLRWINYLRPDLKRGAFSPQEEQLIIHLHSILGNSTDNTSSDPCTDIMEGGMFMSMHDHDLMAICMESSLTSTTTTSSSSMNNSSMIMKDRDDHFGIFPPFHQNSITRDANVASSLFNVSPCIGEIGIGGDRAGYGDCGILEVPYMMGMESDNNKVASRVTDGDANANPTSYMFEKKSPNFNNHFNVDIDGKVKVEEVVGYENHWPGESLKMGEWDIEGLLANIPSLPYLDF